MQKGEIKEATRDKYLGKVFESENYGGFKVVNYVNSNNVDIEFFNTKTRINTTVDRIKRRCVKDHNYPTVYGVGYAGCIQKRGVATKSNNLYSAWHGMLQRCYDDVFKNRHITYLNTTVASHFHSFHNFSIWAKEQQGYNNVWQLDKDILGGGCNTYSQYTCCFVPREINNLCLSSKKVRGDLPIGVSKKDGKFRARLSIFNKEVQVGVYNTPEEAFYAYKQAKETHIKNVANKWKDKIEIRVYEALMNWEIKITD